VLEAVDALAADGVPLDFMRIRAFPFAPEVAAFLNAHDLNFIVEQNRDAQLRSLLVLETDVSKDRLRSLLYYGGLPVSRKHVVEGVLQLLGPGGNGRRTAQPPDQESPLLAAQPGGIDE
jgi:2-oxoglutarate ferredoxin oxidoreductase subunit alpha